MTQKSNTGVDGGRMSAIPFKHIWCVDFEFQAFAGNNPRPVCLVARELRSNRVVRLWETELLSFRQAPFSVGADTLFVAYAASAELACFMVMGWSAPENILDLFAEHRAETNGLQLPLGNGLLSACTLRGIASIGADLKDTMRSLILDQNSWSASEAKSILEYCESDVDALTALLKTMAPGIDWPRALLRGRYAPALARMELSGVPIDVGTHATIRDRWPEIKPALISEVDQSYNVYDGPTFKQDRFQAWLNQDGIAWPRLASGRLELTDEVFKERAKLHPQLSELHELRRSLAHLRVWGSKVGHDGRARTSLRPFRSVTGRNYPAAREFIFGPAKWQRGLVQPAEGQGLAYIDFGSQEIGIAAGLSGDPKLIVAYMDGDPYLAFAKQARLVPADATKASHTLIRERCKTVVLGLNYGMGAESMAAKAGIPIAEARLLIDLHRSTYRRFWRWSDDVVNSAMISNAQCSVFGWRRHIKSSDKPTSLMNFPMQANGAEMMRITAIAATEAGIEVCAPIHDAFLIAAPLERLDENVRHMCEIMSKAGSCVTGGLPIRTEARIIRYPSRYMEERGISMWNRVVRLVGRPDAIYPVIA